jgi:uncharacterized protein (AIM24 family)
MSLLAVQGGATGTGTVTLLAPVTNTNQTLTLPDVTGTVQVSGAAISGTTGTFSGNLSFNSGYGSAAVGYGCRAWVNFNGTGTVAIRASGNVSSITDNGTGDYTINFTTAITDVNYAVSGAIGGGGGSGYLRVQENTSTAMLTTSLSVNAINSTSSSNIDQPYILAAIFR